ncbi:ATP-binding cassette, subfamily B [Cognatiyoonia sediminum]|uniref:ATP-binding cassette, subfamily B n=1 Tax=Cognatiyoonia sediminum TaxID=1508389 RepID=A0A1M5QM22_9RHOB|nr:ABC transporter ATP-binding protein [Cognatiyoonia sediminum]SHH15165.1 ATP-binding cassette, subfamily B [Cognatiyoonia sediminum]
MNVAKLINPYAPADGPPPATLFKFLVWSFSGGFKYVALGSVISILAGVVDVSTALILGLVIDAALTSDSASFFSENTTLLLAISLFFLILRPVVMGLSGIMQSVVIGPSLANLILSRLHRHTLGQSVSFFDDDFAGRIAQKQLQASRAATNLVVEMIHTVMFALASLIGSIILMLTIDLRTALLMTVWLIGYFFLIRFFMPKIRAASKERASKRAMVTGQVVDTVTNIKTVKLFAHKDREDRAAIDAMSELWDASVNFGWTSASFRFFLTTLAGIIPILMVGATLYSWTIGDSTAGAIATSGAIGLRLSQMTGWVSFTLMTMYADVGEVEDAIRTLSPAHTLKDLPGATELEVTKGQIVFDHTSFSYGKAVGGIHDVNLTINAGERLGIVGASGAGKSTLVALLLRLYDTEEGTISIDGSDISKVTQESLRQNIGMVTQETAMFNRSARDNILYGDPTASEDDMRNAAKRAEANEFIEGLEDHSGRTGYDAYLGERGVKLSGGQRQRIAIARAMLKDAPILVLDEATSALDSEVEASIQAALESVMDGKTVIAIAHRLSTLAQMDRIIVLDEGRIVEKGNHATLIAQNGLYTRYWNRQSGGFINVQRAAE